MLHSELGRLPQAPFSAQTPPGPLSDTVDTKPELLATRGQLPRVLSTSVSKGMRPASRPQMSLGTQSGAFGSGDAEMHGAKPGPRGRVALAR